METNIKYLQRKEKGKSLPYIYLDFLVRFYSFKNGARRALIKLSQLPEEKLNSINTHLHDLTHNCTHFSFKRMG